MVIVTQSNIALNKIHIDAELEKQNSIRTDAELAQLRMQILTEGQVRDPFVIWLNDGLNYLVDGFSRYRILISIVKKLQQSPNDITPQEQTLLTNTQQLRAHMVQFKSLEEARFWITINQTSRRNLTDEQKVFHIGSLYNRLKTAKDVEAYLGARGGNEDISPSLLEEKTRTELLGLHFNVNEKTVRRASYYAKGIERIKESEKADDGLVDEILRGHPIDGADFTQKVIEAIGQMDRGQWREIKWKSPSDLIGKLKPKPARLSPEEDTTGIKQAFNEFLAEPTKPGLAALEKLLKQHLDLRSRAEMKVA